MTKGPFRARPWLFVLLGFAASIDATDAAKKVVVCHRPPGRADKAHTISVGAAAVPAHLAHGDALGECPSGCLENGATCDDGNACTADVCLPNGQCAHPAVSCDDGKVCTVDSCSSTLGCLYAPVPPDTACDDGNACTSDDACAAMTCAGSAIAGCCLSDVQCDDGNSCTVDQCDGATCVNEPVDCAVADRCRAGFCDPHRGQCDAAPVSCDDGDVCTDDSCNPSEGCRHTPTTHPPESSEVSCHDGADNDCDGRVDLADADCVQENECEDGVALCHPGACVDQPEGYSCDCPTGYVFDGTGCADINECADADGDPCGPTGICNNEPGSYTCSCESGYVFDGISCADVNECADEAGNPCGPDGTCNNQPGSYTCSCDSGYVFDGTGCVDVNECADEAGNPCGPDGTCNNQPGSYTCSCDTGYVFDGTGCVDAAP